METTDTKPVIKLGFPSFVGKDSTMDNGKIDSTVALFLQGPVQIDSLRIGAYSVRALYSMTLLESGITARQFSTVYRHCY